MSAAAVLVTGATGYIGGRLVPRLLEAGYAVRCLARSPRKLADRPWSTHPRVENGDGCRQAEREAPALGAPNTAQWSQVSHACAPLSRASGREIG